MHLCCAAVLYFATSEYAGLNRSGKSCRLRWVNYLHPDLKRGRMSPDEERLVVELHAKWGNRWSRIARSMPGRTDNEIKNYWRTHTRKLKHKHRHHQEEEESTKVATSASASTSTSAATTSPSSTSSSSDVEVVQEAASKEDEQQQLLCAGTMDDGQLLWNDDGIDAYASWSGATSSMMMVPSSPVWPWDDHYCCPTDSLWGHDEVFEYKKMLHS
ncbi:transcription factor MYB48 isoform X1 [Brachypodium distachyon]|uniref:Uncharacterized protein n=1 Tax=Brachypodium distachyon TaxID=15368 RepID=A0A0Q3J1I0_BRADI|nr:transcription factor MYB48 isoform X1 [Brachypodium distachyon]KQK11803.1 hypothetical protein BRADI_2g62510v3 [Brachypodium distachyon]|eukprot:XP_024314946.1 transcription factor MYB48 isoform X1 [Brachypodium distachyon]